MIPFSVRKLDFSNEGIEPCVIDHFYSGDKRGSFSKCFESTIYQARGISFHVNETFVSVSAKNVIRGLHFQLHEPQAKLVSVLAGRVCDVVVDLRPDSPSFKRWRMEELSEENHRTIYIPRGFAHGFASMEDGTIMLYHCDGAYNKDSDTGIRFDDPDIGIEWPVEPKLAIHSERDMSLMTLHEYMSNPMQVYIKEKQSIDVLNTHTHRAWLRVEKDELYPLPTALKWRKAA